MSKPTQGPGATLLSSCLGGAVGMTLGASLGFPWLLYFWFFPAVPGALVGALRGGLMPLRHTAAAFAGCAAGVTLAVALARPLLGFDGVAWAPALSIGAWSGAGLGVFLARKYLLRRPTTPGDHVYAVLTLLVIGLQAIGLIPLMDSDKQMRAYIASRDAELARNRSASDAREAAWRADGKLEEAEMALLDSEAGGLRYPDAQPSSLPCGFYGGACRVVQTGDSVETVAAYYERYALRGAFQPCFAQDGRQGKMVTFYYAAMPVTVYIVPSGTRTAVIVVPQAARGDKAALFARLTPQEWAPMVAQWEAKIAQRRPGGRLP